MSRVTSRSRPCWAAAATDTVLPRELDEVDYSEPGVDEDADQYLLFTVPRYNWTSEGSADRKTKVWTCINNGGGTDDRPRRTLNRDTIAADRPRTSNTGGVRVETRLTSTGQSPSSPLSPSSPHQLSPTSRPSAIPVRVTPSVAGRGAVGGPGATGTFSRRDVTRASMFERSSRRHHPVNRHVVNGTTRPHQQAISLKVTDRPRSVSPPADVTSRQDAEVTSAVTQPSQRQHGGTFDKSRGDENNNRDVAKTSSTAKQLTDSPALSEKVNNGVDHVTSAAAAAGDVCNDVDDDLSSKHSDVNIWDYRVTITDVADIITNLGSSEWQDRRNGLTSLQTLLRTDACLTVTDIRKVSEIFARMFHDPQTKVLSVFVETIVDFVAVHADDLTHWLAILLPRLFLKLTSDLRGSIHTKIEQALQAVRENFDARLQIEVLSEFMTEQAQSPCLKLKEAILLYVHELVLDMEADELVNSSALQTLLLRVVLWSSELHSNEIRNLGHAVIAAMFNLKASELALAMTTQPKAIQDHVSRVLKTHMMLASTRESTPTTMSPVSRVSNEDVQQDVKDVDSKQTSHRHRRIGHVTFRDPSSAQGVKPAPTTRPATTGVRRQQVSSIPTRRSSPKQPTSVNSLGRGRHSNGSASASAARETEMLDNGRVPADDVTTTSPLADVSDTLSSIQLSSSVIPDELCIEGSAAERQRQWLNITCALSDPAARLGVRQEAIKKLINVLPNDAASISQPAVTSLLLVLLSATHANDEVSVLASECAAMLLDSVVAALPDGSFQLLSRLITEAAFPANLAALQMLQARLDKELELSDSRLPAIVSSLIKAYEDDDRLVRKAGVDVLIKLYERVGELLWTYIDGLSDAKVKFLKTRFRHASVHRLSSSSQ